MRLVQDGFWLQQNQTQQPKKETMKTNCIATRVLLSSLILATVISAILLCAAAAAPTPTAAPVKQTAKPAATQESAAKQLQNVVKDPKAFDTKIKNPEPVKASTSTVTAQQVATQENAKEIARRNQQPGLKTNPVPAPSSSPKK